MIIPVTSLDLTAASITGTPLLPGLPNVSDTVLRSSYLRLQLLECEVSGYNALRDITSVF